MLLKKIFRPIRLLASTIREVGKSSLRSSKWPSVRDRHLKKNPNCAACNSVEHIQVHHIKPFHLEPDLELDPKNLISLCMGKNECHLLIGHGDSFKCYNPNVRADAEKYLNSSEEARKLIVENAKNNRLA